MKNFLFLTFSFFRSALFPISLQSWDCFKGRDEIAGGITNLNVNKSESSNINIFSQARKQIFINIYIWKQSFIDVFSVISPLQTQHQHRWKEGSSSILRLLMRISVLANAIYSANRVSCNKSQSKTTLGRSNKMKICQA